MKIMVLIISCLMLISCTTVGNKEITDSSKTSQIIEGKTTKADVLALLGEPNHVSNMLDGQEVWLYSYGRFTTRPATYIPIVGLFAGGGDMKTKSLSLIFDEKGILKKTSKGQIKGGGGSVLD